MTAADPGPEQQPGARNLADLVRAAAVARPDGTAFVFRDVRLTWADVDRQVDVVARGLGGLGLARGDRVGIRLGNTPDFPVVWYGALRAGLVAVLVNPGYVADEVAHLLGDSGARVLVTDREGADAALLLRPRLDALEHVVVAGGGGVPDGALALERLPGGDGGPVETVAGGEDLAVVLYTAGTSGRPRGAMLTHRALLADQEHVDAIEPPVVGADDVVLLVLPLFHVYGLNVALGQVVRQAATGVLCERFDPADTLAQVREHGVTCVLGAPPMFLAWSQLPGLRDGFATVRVALSGAAPLPRAVLERFEQVSGRRVHEGYGLTETAPLLTATLMSEHPKADSIGRAVPGVELRLLDEAGRQVEDGDPGEVVARGANLFSGYWPTGEGGPDADGWFATGDIAYADRDGDLHLVDRRRELVLVNGFNVYPREVEVVLLTHPDVLEAAVIGVPDPVSGETVKALLVVRDGAAPSTEEVVAHCARSLARFKCPTVVELVPELPRTATGKVRKGHLRELAG